jgi:hypothetical protein
MKTWVPLFAASLFAAAGSPAVAGDSAGRGEPDERPWAISASTYGFFVPDAPDFIMAIVPVDVGLLHAEVRYNYEALHAGSGFVGLNARWGERLKLVFTPMFGGVAGDLDGVIPALRLTVSWWKLELHSESEIVFVLHEKGSTFFYDWSQLGIYPLRWLRVGAVVERTRRRWTSSGAFRERHVPVRDAHALRVQPGRDHADVGPRDDAHVLSEAAWSRSSARPRHCNA